MHEDFVEHESFLRVPNPFVEKIIKEIWPIVSSWNKTDVGLFY